MALLPIAAHLLVKLTVSRATDRDGMNHKSVLMVSLSKILCMFFIQNLNESNFVVHIVLLSPG